jgi:hypothetical protein
MRLAHTMRVWCAQLKQPIAALQARSAGVQLRINMRGTNVLRGACVGVV